jgi:hypothetical protein
VEKCGKIFKKVPSSLSEKINIFRL